MLLATTTALLTVVTGSTQNVGCYAAWMDTSASGVAPGRQVTPLITSATTTTIVPAPSASTYRKICAFSVQNQGTLAETVTVNITDGSAGGNNTVSLWSAALQAGWTIKWGRVKGWQLLNASGTVVQAAQYVYTPIRLVLGYAASTPSQTLMPAGAYVYQLNWTPTTVYSGGTGATLAVGITGNTSLFAGTDRFNLFSLTDPGTVMLANTPVGSVAAALLATIGGGATSGAGVLEAFYATPNT